VSITEAGTRGMSGKKKKPVREFVSFRLTVAGKTDVGLVRSNNQDYLHLDEKNHVYAVCDGMGGHQAGEVASMTASETMRSVFRSFEKQILNDSRLHLGRTIPPSGELLVKSIRLANRNVYNMAMEDKEKQGMGTTVVAMSFESDTVSSALVGDSRAYRLDEHKLLPLTRDHSWVSEVEQQQGISHEEASQMVAKNIITRALGVRKNVEVDYALRKMKPGQIFMMCSDGLCGFADDEEIFDVANVHRDDLGQMVDDLVQMANERGGNDNVTVIAIRVEEVTDSPIPEVEPVTIPEENDELLAVEDSWLKQIRDFLAEEEDRAHGETESKGSGGKFGTLLVFVAFIVVAAAIIYFTTAK